MASIQTAAQASPYPKSERFAGVQWDFGTNLLLAEGSDQWPMTQAKDGNLYGAWGDGWGWTKDDEKRSIGVTRIEGNPPDLVGTDLWGAGPGSGFAKPEALIAIRNELFLFYTSGKSKDYSANTHLARSPDLGKTWTLSETRAFPDQPDGFRVRGICQFGPGYEGTRDEYVYVYFGFNFANDLFLARVSASRITHSDRYEWYAGTRTSGKPAWTKSFEAKTPVFSDANGSAWHVGVSYHPGLKRYFLCKPHFTEVDDREAAFADPGIASLGIFDAPEPWGPWTTVVYEDEFLDGLHKFSYFMPPKYFGEDDRSFWLVWSGWPEYDAIMLTQGQLIAEDIIR
ncbi:MAG: DUF4185 domain-containing protein [Verrucomicrobiae bacterium]|nr:DUF4185 domain-containing protein [Verrucomicrobiae bacterium]